ncbi:MAG: hypothetical protein VW270_04190 [Candidatus Poseidoniales archaeon]
MTPDLLNKISSIVNTSFVPKNLNEISQKSEEEEKIQVPKNNTIAFQRIVNSLKDKFRNAKVKMSTKPYKLYTGTDVEKMPKGSYMRVRGDKASFKSIGNTTVNTKVNDGDLVMKDHFDGQTRVVKKQVIDSGNEYTGSVGGPLTPKSGTVRKVARYTGPTVYYVSGQEEKELKQGDWIVQDGGNFLSISTKEFTKNFDI